VSEAAERSEPLRPVRFTRKDGKQIVFTPSRLSIRSEPRPDPPRDVAIAHGRTGMTGDLTLEAFAALVAALRAELTASKPVDRERILRRTLTPKCFTGRPWVWQPVTLAEAADLTGVAVTTLRRYARPSDRDGGRRRLPGPLLPPPLGTLPAEGMRRSPPNVWDAAAIALWYAGRQRRVPPQPGRRRAPARYPKDMRVWSRTVPRRRFALLAYLRALIREDTAISVTRAAEMVAAAGLDTAGASMRYCYVEARRAEARTFIARLQDESVHPEGLVTLSQVASVYGVRHGSLWKALKRGELKQAGRDEHGRALLDPSRLRMLADEPHGHQLQSRLRRGLSRVPVDMDAPNALPLPPALGAVLAVAAVIAPGLRDTLGELVVLTADAVIGERFAALAAMLQLSLLTGDGDDRAKERLAREPAERLSGTEDLGRGRLVRRGENRVRNDGVGVAEGQVNDQHAMMLLVRPPRPGRALREERRRRPA